MATGRSEPGLYTATNKLGDRTPQPLTDCKPPPDCRLMPAPVSVPNCGALRGTPPPRVRSTSGTGVSVKAQRPAGACTSTPVRVLRCSCV